MYHKQLVKHITHRRNEKATDVAIRKEVEGDGWSKEDIDEAFEYANHPEKQKHFSLGRLLRSEVSTFTFLSALCVTIAISLLIFLKFGTEVNNYVLVTQAAVSPEKVAFSYGVQPALSNPDFFNKIKTQFIDTKATFIEVDLSQMVARVYTQGVVTVEVPVKTKGKEGSWWETPAGLYKIQTKEKSHYSSMGHVSQPWSMQFQGNFFIHGWPTYDDGRPVSSTFSGGCVRLADEDAKKIYDAVTVGTPILVYEKDFILDQFSYAEKKPVPATDAFLYADMHNNFVFLEQDRVKQVPIGGLTKLMTALIATEYINIEKTTVITESDLVPTDVPRLKVGMKIDMYQLLFPLLRESSNEAGEAIARSYGRSGFVKHMNDKAKSIGMTHTRFVDPTGESAENVSTAEDLFMLAKYIYNNRSFIFNITTGTVKTNTYGESIFSSLEQANSLRGNRYFYGGVSGTNAPFGEYNLSVFKLPMNGTVRPLFLITVGSKNEQEDITQGLEYITDKF
jgi:lipoprotein-anchoring transpeptidase ErfK/SrfK